MASVQTPVRQPFGVLDSSKLRNLQSIKNCQNAPSSAPLLKRRHVALDLSDSENVDPIDFKAAGSKRMKTDTSDDLCKPSAFTLKTFPKPKSRISSSSILTPRPETPTINTAIKPTITSSAPAAAGRSPIKSKRSGILSNRRTRLNAPVLGGRSRAPLSLAAALNGTIANKKHKKHVDTATLEDSKPKSWFFDIYEETEAQQDFVVNEWTMTQSACSLDISDDESKAVTQDDRGKENVPPNEVHSLAITPSGNAPSTQAATSRKDMMTDEPRTPLGDLNPSDYYADGHDATSIVLVAEDEPEPEKPTASDAAQDLTPEAPSTDFNFSAGLPATEGEQDKLMTKAELSSLLLGAASSLPSEQDDVEAGLFDRCHGGADAETVEPADIEIWESGSAKDESGDMEARDSIFAVL
ncbi:hypothetical protein EPUS_01200 [Endocarpon pusillum Z07020]|uniref:Thymidylate kinase n=1 Tax=Endocarpon pusillum (strain Z07020 / HMAS-L-300199) TaxID=1263415 RepID=U1I1M5_ENDPU|nr:uncharacterized protein EPUS_01200 [Endocarpon pusillum Z07020]ERF75834.1 hypothetical protein EPUS_01200 [Endocarpon pusillum Z07020]